MTRSTLPALIDRSWPALWLLTAAAFGASLTLGVIKADLRQAVNADLDQPDLLKTLAYVKSAKAIHQPSLKTDNWQLIIDPIQWLTGPEANQAALDDGACAESGSCLPNGFYLRNQSRATYAFTIAPDADIQMQTYERADDGSLKSSPVSLEQFTKFFSDKTPWAAVPYHVVIERGVITKIVEQYIP